MFEILRFRKSYDVRYEEYVKIFSIFKFDALYIQSYEVQKMWSYYLEFSNIPLNWTAYWKMPRYMCLDLHIPFPSDPVVMIEKINLTELTATINIKYVDDYISEEFPPQFTDVPLKDLIFASEQNNLEPDFRFTAQVLDQLRLFYNHLWYPWDTDDEHKTEDWAGNYLECRLKLYYDLNFTRSLHPIAEERIWNLIRHGRKLYADIEEIRNSEETYFGQIKERVSRLHIIQHKLNILEDIDYRKRYSNEISATNAQTGFNIIIPKCSVQQTLKHLQDMEDSFPSSGLIKTVSCKLQKSLSNSIPDDVIVVCSGQHEFHSIGGLRKGGTLTGLYSNKPPTIIESEPPRALIECYGIFDLIIKDIIIEIKHCKEAVVVSQGHLKMNNVVINHVSDIIGDGILVCEKATFTAENCSFFSFQTAIICLSKSQIVLKNCVFKNNSICIMIHEGAEVSFDSCNMESNNEHCVRMAS